MTNQYPGPPDFRRLVGTNVGRLLDARGWRQLDLAGRMAEHRLGRWDASVVARVTKGERAISFQEALALAAVLSVPLIDLLQGDQDVTFGRAGVVPAAQLRDVASRGRVADANSANTVLDTLAVTGDAFGPVTAQIAAELGVSPAKAEDTAFATWDLYIADELTQRLRGSEARFLGREPGVIADTLAATGSGPKVSARQRRAWQGHHIRVMTHELAEAMGAKKEGGTR